MRGTAAAPVLVVSVLAGCATADVQGPTLVLGLQSNLSGVLHLVVEASADGVALPEEEWILEEGGLEFPREVPFGPVAPGAAMEVHVQSYDADPEILVERRILTTLPPEGEWLARVRLAEECIPAAQLPGGLNAPECEAPETCIAAQCVDPAVPTDELEPYTPTWADEYADPCKPLPPGTPSLVLGVGQDAFGAIEDGGDVTMQLGVQGGYHLWFGARIENLHQNGSKTTLSVVSEDGTVDMGSQVWGNAYVPEPGGTCAIVGLQFFTPSEYWDSSLIGALVDLPVRVDAQVVDERGDVAFTTLHAFLR